MKFLLCLSFLTSFSVSAESLSVSALKALFAQNQATLEKVSVGQSVKEVSREKIVDSSCELTVTTTKTVLRVEAERTILHTLAKTVPSNATACADYIQEEVPMLVYEERVLLKTLQASMDEMSPVIKTIEKSGNVVVLDYVSNGASGKMVMDLTLSGVNFVTSISAPDYSSTTSALADVDVNTVDLSNILFCEWDEEGEATCTRGDYSDVLY